MDHEELYSIIIDTNQKDITFNEFENILKDFADGIREEPYVNGEFIIDITEIGFYNFYVDNQKQFAEEMIEKLNQKHIKAKLMTDEELELFWDECDDLRNDEATIKVIFKDKTFPIKLTPVSEEEAAE